MPPKMPPLKKPKVPKCQAAMPRFCQRVVEDVVVNMRQAFLDDGVGEQVLQRMLHMWRSKILSSKSLDLSPAIPPPDDSKSSNDVDLEEALDFGPSTSKAVKREVSGSLGTAFQLDGALDTSDEETEDQDLSDNDDKESEEEADSEQEGDADDNKEDPLNSNDDLTDDEDIEDKFETENMVACQYDAVSRSRNKWKFIFRDGMMNIHGKEFLFKRAEGDAVW